jgi:hypothetical protein
MNALTENKLKGLTERLESVISDLLRPDGDKVERFLDKLDEPGNAVKLSNFQGVIRVIDRDYHSAAAGPFSGSGSFGSDEYFEPILIDKQAGKGLQKYLADCTGRLRESRADLVDRHPKLFS